MTAAQADLAEARDAVARLASAASQASAALKALEESRDLASCVALRAEAEAGEAKAAAEVRWGMKFFVDLPMCIFLLAFILVNASDYPFPAGHPGHTCRG